MIQLYDYQQDIIKKTRTQLAKKEKHILVQSPTGSGKTVIFSYIISEMKKKGKRALILTDRIELLFETGGTLEQFGLVPYHIVAGQMVEPPAQFQVYVGMSQTIRLRFDKWRNFWNWFDMIIIDECFIAGTKIGEKNIEDIKIGDIVDSFNHKTNRIEKKKVLSTFKNEIKNNLIEISLCCDSIVCTKKHPIFVVGKGYINAENIEKNDRIILHNLRKSNEKRRFQAKQLVRQEKTIFKKWAIFLFSKMQIRVFCINALRKDEKIKSNAKRGYKIKNVKHSKKDRAQTNNSRRQWKRINCNTRITTNTINRKNISPMVSRIGNYFGTKRDKWRKISSLLQNRYWMYKSKNSNRNRWWLSFVSYSKKKRCKKNADIRIERVQSVKIYEQRNNIKHPKCSKFNYVYNFEVEDNNNYFANGVLVHNCHKQEFNPFFEQEKFKCPILGFTATPVRTGKQRQLFQDYSVMIEGLQVPELIKRGKLVKDKYYGFQGIETSGAKYNSQGDYSESWMFDKFNKTELYSGVVENWQKICPETSTLVFCVNIQHTIETCKAFNDAGIKAKFLVSSVPMPQLTDENDEAKRVIFERKKKEYDNYVTNYQLYSGERKSIVKQWCEHKFEVLINAGILTTGFNRKDLQTVIVDRATTSVALWLQMIGRGSRPYPGKEFFNILDFGGNGQRLGYYNQQRRWSLVHETRESGGEPPVKECGKDYKPDENGNTGCQAYVFVSAKICPFCGYVFEKEKQEKFVELEHIDYTIDITPKETHEEEFQNWERIAESRGYKAAWVIPQIINKYGSDGLLEYSKYKRYQSSWYWLTKQRFAKLINNYNEKNI